MTTSVFVYIYGVCRAPTFATIGRERERGERDRDGERDRERERERDRQTDRQT